MSFGVGMCCVCVVCVWCGWSARCSSLRVTFDKAQRAYRRVHRWGAYSHNQIVCVCCVCVASPCPMCVCLSSLSFPLFSFWSARFALLFLLRCVAGLIRSVGTVDGDPNKSQRHTMTRGSASTLPHTYYLTTDNNWQE